MAKKWQLAKRELIEVHFTDYVGTQNEVGPVYRWFLASGSEFSGKLLSLSS